MTIGVRDDETVSYDIARSLPIGMTTAVVLSSLLGVASFLLSTAEWFDLNVSTIGYVYFINIFSTYIIYHIFINNKI